VLAHTASRTALGHLNRLALDIGHIVLSDGDGARAGVDQAELERGPRGVVENGDQDGTAREVIEPRLQSRHPRSLATGDNERPG
jgi:hypothetical protein